MPRDVVGRDVEFTELAALLADDRPAVVVGEAGIGKTALLRAVAAASGRRVAEGGALSTLTWLQYLPLERALGTSMGGGDPTAVAGSVERRTGSGVLLLDDLHWADAATVEVVTLLAGRVGLLAGVRRGDGAASTVLDRFRAAGFTEVPLAPLGAEDAAAVVRSLRPDLGTAAVRRVVDRTGGNPLLLRELTTSGEPTASLRLAIAARLRRLDAVGRDTFALLALAGRPLPAETLDEAGVKSLLDADLVVEASTGIAVRHALLAEVMIEQLSDDEVRELHLTLAGTVGDDGEAAHHYRLAGARQAAYEAALRAAQRSERAGEQAAHLAIAAECASGPTADELRLRAAEALEHVHDWDGMVRVLDLIDPDNRDAQAMSFLLRGRGAWTAGDSVRLRQMLDAGLELVRGTGSTVEVRLLIEQSRLPVFVDDDHTEGVAATARALELAHAAGVDVARAEYLHGTALVVAELPGAAEHLHTAISAARRAGDTNTEFLAANNLISYHESTDDPSAGRAVCDEFIARAAELGLGEWELTFETARATLDFHSGDYPAVLAVAEDLIDRVHERRGRDSMIETFCVTLVDLGRIDEALRRLEQTPLTDDHRGWVQKSWVEAEAALWGGRPARTVELADACLAHTPNDPNLELFKVARAWALWQLDREPGPAPELHSYPMLHAVRPEIQGVGELAAGRDARASFERAAAAWAPFHRRGELRCRWALGEATRRAGDTSGAVRILTDVERIALEQGLLPLLGRVHQSLRAAGVQRSAPRTRRSGDLLSGRQREVLRLVGEGRTNAEIAQRLGISRHTVVSQLASAAAKLGATGRTHAAAIANEQP
jgi:DNA-binding CsgD family transcriptional regulator